MSVRGRIKICSLALGGVVCKPLISGQRMHDGEFAGFISSVEVAESYH